MKHYGPAVAEGSEVINLTAPSGLEFPDNINVGELFFKTDENKLYMYGNDNWTDIVTGDSGGTTYAAGDGITIADVGSPAVPTISIDLSASPIWTGEHTFETAVNLESGTPALYFNKTDGDADEKKWAISTYLGNFNVATQNDADDENRFALKFERDGIDITTMTYGNNTDNPAHVFHGVSYTFNGPATGTSFNGLTGFANPSASIGLTAVNGSATTAMRSDGAPALSQSITPTWTGTHTFSKTGHASSSALILSSNDPALMFSDINNGTDAKHWQFISNGNNFSLSTINDSYGSDKYVLLATRAGNVISSQQYGNTTDNPTHNMYGPLVVSGSNYPQIRASASSSNIAYMEASHTSTGEAGLILGNNSHKWFFYQGDSSTMLRMYSSVNGTMATLSEAGYLNTNGNVTANASVDAVGWGDYYSGHHVRLGVTGGFSYVHRYNPTSGTYPELRLSTSQLSMQTDYVYGGFSSLKDVMQLYDGWLRLNQSNHFSNGVYTPYNIRTDGDLYLGSSALMDSSVTSYGSVRVSGLATGGWYGLQVDDGVLRPTLMASGGGAGGIYNIGDGKWALYRNSSGEVYTEYGNLAVKPGSGSAYLNIMRASAGTGQAGITLSSVGGTIWHNYLETSDDTTLRWYYSSTLMTLNSSGNLTATGDVTAYSDARLKTNIETIDDPLTTISNLRGVRFDWNEKSIKSGKPSIGFIAQELEQVYPELVHEVDDYKTVAYAPIVALLVEGIKQLTERVKSLEGE